MTEDYKDALMREQLELERNLRHLIAKSEELIKKLRSSEERVQERVKHPQLSQSSFEMIQASEMIIQNDKEEGGSSS